MNPDAKRSPLDRFPPMRVAGQSLDQELEDVVYDHALSPLILAVFMTCPQSPYQPKFQKSGVCKVN